MRPIDNPDDLKAGSVIRFVSGKHQGEERVLLAKAIRAEVWITADGDIDFDYMREHAMFLRRDEEEMRKALIQKEWLRALWGDQEEFDKPLDSPRRT